LKLGVSACLLGANCNFDGKNLLSLFVKNLQSLIQIEFVPFCPEDSVFGSPRANLRIVGGDGYDVLGGGAKVIDEKGLDVTDEQICGAQQFLRNLLSKNVQAAILMDGSPSCGSNVILKEENWPQGGFRAGTGVTAALLRRNGIKVLSSFDEHTISKFLSGLIEDYKVDESLKDLKDSPKFHFFR
jgi:uncharacterized protein YbbK (DUF523 family)